MHSSSSADIFAAFSNNRCNRKFIETISVGFKCVANITLSGAGLGYRACKYACQYIINGPTDILKAARANSNALIDYGVKGSLVGYYSGFLITSFSQIAITLASTSIGFRIGATLIFSNINLSAPDRVRVSNGISQNFFDGLNAYVLARNISNAERNELKNDFEEFWFYPIACVFPPMIESVNLLIKSNPDYKYSGESDFVGIFTIGCLFTLPVMLNRSRVVLEKMLTMEKRFASSSHHSFNQHNTSYQSRNLPKHVNQENMDNPYILLGISETASQAEIAAAFRKKAMKYHPDKGVVDDTKFKQLVNARAVLVDSNARQLVDIELQRKRHKM